MLETTIPADLAEELFSSIKLNTPKTPITFKPAEQSYLVNNTSFEGKPVQIIEGYEKTRILIDGKTYNISVITTSGRGTGSPKSQGF
jgi:hypothetical protein